MPTTKQWKMLVNKNPIIARLFLLLTIMIVASPNGFAATPCVESLEKDETTSKEFFIFKGQIKKLKGFAVERECIRSAEDELLKQCKQTNFKRCVVLDSSYALNGSYITPTRTCGATILGSTHKDDKQFYNFMKNRCEKISSCEEIAKKQNPNEDNSLFLGLYKKSYSCHNLEKFLVFSNFKQSENFENTNVEQASGVEKTQ